MSRIFAALLFALLLPDADAMTVCKRVDDAGQTHFADCRGVLDQGVTVLELPAQPTGRDAGPRQHRPKSAPREARPRRARSARRGPSARDPEPEEKRADSVPIFYSESRREEFIAEQDSRCRAAQPSSVSASEREARIRQCIANREREEDSCHRYYRDWGITFNTRQSGRKRITEVSYPRSHPCRLAEEARRQRDPRYDPGF